MQQIIEKVQIYVHRVDLLQIRYYRSTTVDGLHKFFLLLCLKRHLPHVSMTLNDLLNTP
jgi:hypothetical protein